MRNRCDKKSGIRFQVSGKKQRALHQAFALWLVTVKRIMGLWGALCCTTSNADLSKVEVSPETGLDGTSYVQCELVRSIDRNRLVHRLGAIDSDTNHRIATIVRTLLNY